jgi:hypothetical protein
LTEKKVVVVQSKLAKAALMLSVGTATEGRYQGNKQPQSPSYRPFFESVIPDWNNALRGIH